MNLLNYDKLNTLLENTFRKSVSKLNLKGGYGGKSPECVKSKKGGKSPDEKNKIVGFIIVKKMDMLPIECVVRGYFYGGLFSRWKNGKISLEKDAPTELAAQLPKPIFDSTTKSTHDIPVNREEAISRNLVTTDEYDWLSEKSIKIYEEMVKVADKAGFILADLKLEFGKLNNEIILADSIGPDEFRLWPKDAYKIGETQEAYDKQLLRDWLTENGYQEKFDDARSRGEEPIAPSIPSDLVSKMTQRYVTAYQKLTGNML